MRIPKWQTMVSASPGFQYRAQLRAQPGEARPVLGETYLQNPRAGFDDINLAVAAAGSGKYLASAVSKGLQDIGNTLATLEAEDQLTNMSSEFQLEIGSQLSDLTEQKISEPTVDWFNGKPQPGLLPAYKNSLTTFTTWINNRRDYYAKKMTNGVARRAFLKGSSNDVAQAIAQAASVNRKQQIRWMQGNLYRTAENLQNPDDLDALYKSPLANTIVTAQQLKTLIEGRKNRLAMDDAARRLLTANHEVTGSIEQLEQFRRGLVDGMDYQEGARATDPDAPIGEREYTYNLNPYHKLYSPAQLLELDTKAARMIKAREDADDLRLEQNFSDAIVGIHDNPYAPEYNRDALHAKVESGDLDPKDLPALLTARKNAIALKGVTVESNPRLSTEILTNISDPEYTVAFIQSHPQLSEANKRTLIAAKQVYEREAVDWKSADNPDGHWGAEAVSWLQKAYNHVPGMFAIGPPGSKTAQNEDNYNRALVALEVMVEGWRQTGLWAEPTEAGKKAYTNKEILRKAYDYAFSEFKRLKIDTRVNALEETNIASRPIQHEGTIEQYEEWKGYAIDAGRRINDGSPLTYEGLLSMPPGKTRDDLAIKFQGYGWTFHEGFVGEETDLQALIREADERGDGVEATFIKLFPSVFGPGAFAEGWF